jgi:VanZ family protein
LRQAAGTLAITLPNSASEDEQVSSTLSQIAAVVAGLALLATGFVVFSKSPTRRLVKSLAVSMSLAVLAAVLISVARNLGS